MSSRKQNNVNFTSFKEKILWTENGLKYGNMD